MTPQNCCMNMTKKALCAARRLRRTVKNSFQALRPSRSAVSISRSLYAQYISLAAWTSCVRRRHKDRKALSNLPFSMHQRGLSGQKYTWTQTIIGGMEVLANIHLHGDVGPPMMVTFWKATDTMKPNMMPKAVHICHWRACLSRFRVSPAVLLQSQLTSGNSAMPI